uniref:Ig-like domain-containing protein n=1 Tax=Romanomermis culicivorax TaxID=13658 RepID=A0A915J7K3_ROMCU
MREEKIIRLIFCLANPELGPDEVVEAAAGSLVTLDCTPKDERFRTSITWIKDNEEAQESADNVKVGLSGRKLYINKVELYNDGIYTCIVRNLAGETHKNVYLRVLIPPSFKEKNYKAHHKIPIGRPLTLKCITFGNPEPETVWEKDGVELSQNGGLMNTIFEENGQILTIPDVTNTHKKSVFTCTAKNGVGLVTRDFYVDPITPPVLSFGGGRTSRVTEIIGEALTLDCPISSTLMDYQIIWYKDGQLMQNSYPRVQISADQRKVRLNNLINEDEGTYTCFVKNPAGEAMREFKVDIIAPPQLIGSNIEYVEVPEGNDLSLKCPFEAETVGQVMWDKNGGKMPSNVQILSDNATIYVHSAAANDEGSYHCLVHNRAGSVEKTFRVKVLLKPRIIGAANDNDTIEAAADRSVVLVCPIQRTYGGEMGDIEIEWFKDNAPLKARSTDRVLPNGKYLHISNSKPPDAVPPTILSNETDFVIPVKQSLLITCDTESSPQASIQWTFNNQDVGDRQNIQILNSGRQLRIVSAEIFNKGRYIEDEGLYTCRVSNRAGENTVDIKVTALEKPSIVMNENHQTVTAVENSSIVLKCPTTGLPKPTVSWLKNGFPFIFTPDSKVLFDGQELQISRANASDSGHYSCIATNEGGSADMSYSLEVLTPPKISGPAEEKAEILETGATALFCDVNGSEPLEIIWTKNRQDISSTDSTAQISSQGRLLNILGAKVDDEDPPKFDVDSEVKEVKVGERLVLPCTIDGAERFNVSWLLNGRPIDSKTPSSFKYDKRRFELFEARLSDTGVYACVVRNEAGSAKKNFDVAVLEVPRFLSLNDTTTSIISGKSVQLNCSITGVPTPVIKWQKD